MQSSSWRTGLALCEEVQNREEVSRRRIRETAIAWSTSEATSWSLTHRTQEEEDVKEVLFYFLFFIFILFFWDTRIRFALIWEIIRGSPEINVIGYSPFFSWAYWEQQSLPGSAAVQAVMTFLVKLQAVLIEIKSIPNYYWPSTKRLSHIPLLPWYRFSAAHFPLTVPQENFSPPRAESKSECLGRILHTTAMIMEGKSRSRQRPVARK
jgi:hypothetical protein